MRSSDNCQWPIFLRARMAFTSSLLVHLLVGGRHRQLRKIAPRAAATALPDKLYQIFHHSQALVRNKQPDTFSRRVPQKAVE